MMILTQEQKIQLRNHLTEKGLSEDKIAHIEKMNDLLEKETIITSFIKNSLKELPQSFLPNWSNDSSSYIMEGIKQPSDIIDPKTEFSELDVFLCPIISEIAHKNKKPIEVVHGEFNGKYFIAVRVE